MTVRHPIALAAALVLLGGGCNLLESDVARPRPDFFAVLDRSPLLQEVEGEARPGAEAAPEARPEPERELRIAGDEPVSLSFRQTPLPEAIQLIAESAGINIYLDAGLRGVIDASFPAVRLDDALQSILTRNGLALVEDPPGIFWVRVADGSERATGRFQLRSVGAASLRAQLEALVTEESTVVVEENQNLVLVRGIQADIDLVEAFLESADRLKPQVLIEVHLFEVGIDNEFQLGFDHTFQGTINGSAFSVVESLLTSASNFQFTLDDGDGDISALVTALREYADLELISSPKVLAITNTQASIEITEEVPYVNVTSTNDAGGGSSVVEEVQFKEVGIKLTVTPTIQEDRVIQIVLDQELSEVVDFFNDIPVVDARQLISQFLVGDRQTTVLGGLMQDQRMNTDGGVPFAMDIPLLGRFFRRDDDSSSRRELLLFLTARIVDPKEAARLTRVYRDEYRENRRTWLESDLPPLGQGR